MHIHPIEYRGISIHSLRMEGDANSTIFRKAPEKFQSTPSVWRETCLPSAWEWTNLFQSTPSVWRETASLPDTIAQNANFNPLPPYGGRLAHIQLTRQGVEFQSTPSVWRETNGGERLSTLFTFQSTPSVWRETFAHMNFIYGISYFNPLPPYGGRLRDFFRR